MKINTCGILIFALVMFGKSICTAQQDPMMSMYMFDKLLINPGFTGSSNWAVATLKHRDQFVGINGRPSTQTFNFHSPIQKKHIGIGIKVIQDRIAIFNNLNAALLLSYHLNFGGGKLSFGIEGGIFNKRTDYQKLILATPGDNLVPAEAVTSLTPDASAGFYFQKRGFYMGFSAYHLIDQAFSMQNNSGGDPSHAHLYYIMGKEIDAGRYWTIEPSLLVKYHAAGALQADINCMAYWDEKIGAGVQYRTGDALVAILRVHITEGLRLAYSYDRTISRLNPYSRGSHEVVLSYGIKLLPPAKQKEIHPRYYF